MSIETYLIYVGVLAAFFATPPDTSELLIVGITCLVVDGLILILWGWAATRTLGRMKTMTSVWINRVSGVLMIGAGVLLGVKDLEEETAK